MSAQSGDHFHQRWLGRAVDSGDLDNDLDNDGDTDLVVSHVGAPPAVLRNDCQRTDDSLRINLIGTRSARQPLGCQVTTVSGSLRQVTQAPSGGSFQVSHDPRVLAPVEGNNSTINAIQIVWANGQTEVWKRHFAGP